MIVHPAPMLWVAFPGMLGGYAKACDIAHQLGFGAIAPRCGTGGWYRDVLSPKDIITILDAGLECIPWWFSHPWQVEREAQAARDLQDAGASALIVDAELPWDKEPNAGKLATQLGGMMMAKGVTVPVFDAPWPAIDFHPGYPWREFGEWVSGRLLQTYWTEIGWSARKTLDTARKQWAGKDARILPIGVTYGRREMQKWGSPQLPPGEIAAADILDVGREMTGGWYSLEAANTAGPDVLHALATVVRPAHEPPPTLPESAATPIGWQDRAEAEAQDEDCHTFYCRNLDTFGAYPA